MCVASILFAILTGTPTQIAVTCTHYENAAGLYDRRWWVKTSVGHGLAHRGIDLGVVTYETMP